MTKITIDRAIVEQEPVGRTDQQIVDQTEELAVWLLHWAFSRQPETPTPMRESRHPMAERCWAAACHIQEMLTATDPENAVSELDGEAPEDTSPQPAQQPVQEPATLAWYDLDAISEGLAEAQVVYQISLKNGPALSAWIDVDEAAYNSAKLYGEYKCRILYTGENNG